eukprot:1326128-Prymnesium_polylepis.1
MDAAAHALCDALSVEHVEGWYQGNYQGSQWQAYAERLMTKGPAEWQRAQSTPGGSLEMWWRRPPPSSRARRFRPERLCERSMASSLVSVR